MKLGKIKTIALCSVMTVLTMFGTGCSGTTTVANTNDVPKTSEAASGEDTPTGESETASADAPSM